MTTKTTNKKEKTNDIIEDITFEASHQAIERRVIYNYKNTRIRLYLKSDSYRNQCFAIAEALDGYEWKIIYSIPYSKMFTPEKLRNYSEFQPNYANFSKAAPYFNTDVKKLKEMVEKLI